MIYAPGYMYLGVVLQGVLKKFLTDKIPWHITAIYALQVFAYNNGSPKGNSRRKHCHSLVTDTSCRYHGITESCDVVVRESRHGSVVLHVPVWVGA